MKEELVGAVKVKGSFHCSDYGLEEVRILRGDRRVKVKTTGLDYTKSHFNLFRKNWMGYNPVQKKGQ